MSMLAVVAVAIVGLLFLAIVPLLSGSEQSGRTQTSADAAALAGAQDVREYVLDQLHSVFTVGGWNSFGTLIGPARGYGAAQSYASANDAELITYSYDPSRDRFSVRTRLLAEAPNGDRAESLATASLGVKLGTCGIGRHTTVVGYEEEPTPEPPPDPPADPDPDESAPPTSSPTPTQTPTPVPILGFEYRFTCDGFDSGWSLEISDLLDDTADWLDDQLVPSLVE
ncbi:hypothetical protein [Pengzhenrongella sicca]|uniref:Uncharacterized protein n=1 Tax=Pengzhenrongella sicca TaxID=2819238 RepID=A0A8A4ZG37_9MICO|nr:hypothetical protein [Pengzhenrongella sicca]QTE29959.1 hypothetical protein J4E96_02730 [Pengzhenrongella sicca]